MLCSREHNKKNKRTKELALGLFIGEANAGDRGAILYTIVESCRRRGLDPYRYLRELLTALPTMTNWQIKDWTPEAWV